VFPLSIPTAARGKNSQAEAARISKPTTRNNRRNEVSRACPARYKTKRKIRWLIYGTGLPDRRGVIQAAAKVRRGSIQREARSIAAVDAASHCGREPRPVAVAPSLEARKFAPSPGHPTAFACLRSRLRLASEHRAERNRLKS